MFCVFGSFGFHYLHFESVCGSRDIFQMLSIELLENDGVSTF